MDRNDSCVRFAIGSVMQKRLKLTAEGSEELKLKMGWRGRTSNMKKVELTWGTEGAQCVSRNGKEEGVCLGTKRRSSFRGRNLFSSIRMVPEKLSLGALWENCFIKHQA